MMPSARTFGLAVALIALAANSCTGSSSKEAPPPNAGTLVVHALMTVGPVNVRTGHAAGEFPMTKTPVQVRATNDAPLVAATDQRGNARFVLAPGVYVVRLAELAHPGPQIDCGVGARGATVRVLAHRTAHAEVACVQP